MNANRNLNLVDSIRAAIEAQGCRVTKWTRRHITIARAGTERTCAWSWADAQAAHWDCAAIAQAFIARAGVRS